MRRIITLRDVEGHSAILPGRKKFFQGWWFFEVVVACRAEGGKRGMDELRVTQRGKDTTMTRAQLSFVAGVFGLLFSLVLYGCGGGDDDNADFPDVRGVYRGTSTQTNSGCLDPANNGTSTDSNATVNISSQSGADFSGTVQGADGRTASLTGQLTTDGASSGTITLASGGVAFQATFNGTLTGNVLTVNYSGRFTAGETCVFQGQLTATRQ
jgi:hypothetical protein